MSASIHSYGNLTFPWSCLCFIVPRHIQHFGQFVAEEVYTYVFVCTEHVCVFSCSLLYRCLVFAPHACYQKYCLFLWCSATESRVISHKKKLSPTPKHIICRYACTEISQDSVVACMLEYLRFGIKKATIKWLQNILSLRPLKPLFAKCVFKDSQQLLDFHDSNHFVRVSVTFLNSGYQFWGKHFIYLLVHVSLCQCNRWK